MALGKTVTYTPFQETSFGYGSSEIATALSSDFPNATDTVKVIITFNANTHMDATGHISTPSSGTAVASYNSDAEEWSCSGNRSDVDAVLDTLSFFPPDYPAIRGWTPIVEKSNNTSGSYTQEEPADTVAIPDTVMSLKVYNGSNTLIQSYTVTFDPTQPTFSNQRPFFSTEPTNGQQFTSSATSGEKLNLGVISHGSDTENVTVAANFRDYSGSATSSVNYGSFSGTGSVYIGNKKPSVGSTTGFSFTGSVAEAQAFLDNIRYIRGSNQTTFDLYFTISDGPTTSYVQRTFWHPHNITTSGSLPSQTTTEDSTLTVSCSSSDLSTTNESTMPETNSVSFTMQLDADGIAIVNTVTHPTATVSYNSSTGVIDLTATSMTNLMDNVLNGLQFTFDTDEFDTFVGNLVMTKANSTVGSSYSTANIPMNFTVTQVDETTFTQGSALNWNEDQTKNFDSGLVINDNSFAGAATFTVTARAKLSSDNSLLTATNASFACSSNGGATVSGNGNATGDLTIVGTKAQCNTALQNLQMVPYFDYSGGPFYLEYKVVRNNDSSNTGFPNYDIQTNFNQGTALKELSLPSQAYYVNTLNAFIPTTGNPIASMYGLTGTSSASWSVTESYSLNYTLNIVIPSTHELYAGSVLQSGDYITDGYVVTDYTRHEFTFTGTPTQVTDYVQSLRVLGTGNFTLSYELFRAGTSGAVDTGSMTVNEIAIPVFSSQFGNVSYDGARGFGPISTTDSNLTRDAENSEQDHYNFAEATIGVTYTGNWSNLSVVGPITTGFAYNRSWSDSNENADAGSNGTSHQSTNRLVYRTADAVLDETNEILTYHNDEPTATDNIGEWSEIRADIQVTDSNTANNVVVFSNSSKRFVTSISHWALLGEQQHDAAVYFAPYKVNDMSISGVTIRAKDPSFTPDPNVFFTWQSNRYYNLTLPQNAQNNKFNTLQSAVTSINQADGLFVAYSAYLNNALKIKFRASGLSQTSQDSFGTLDGIAIPHSTTNGIDYDLGWSSITRVLDSYYDDSNNRFYALIQRAGTNEWKLLKVDTLNSTDLNTSNGTTVMQSGTTECWAGSIGRLADGTIHFAIANGTNNRFDVYHQNEGGTDNFGLKQSITRTYWGGSNVAFNSYFSLYTGIGSWLQANTTGWLLLGTFLYRYNTSTNAWVENDANDFQSSISSSSDLVLKQALGSHTVYKQDPSTSDYYFFRLGRHDGSSTHIYRAVGDETNRLVSGSNLYIQGKSRDNVYVLFDTTSGSEKTYIVRMTK